MDHTHCYAAMSIPNAFIGIAILSCMMSVAVLGSYGSGLAHETTFL
ncbi:hypothetical protein OKW41_003521 [Paraburkholderia sp. UCT70]